MIRRRMEWSQWCSRTFAMWAALVFAVGFLLAGCDQSSSNNQDNAGLLLYNTLAEGEGLYNPELVVSDGAGNELRRITLPGEPQFVIPTRASNKALVRTANDKILLVDAGAGTAKELSLGENAGDLLLRSPQFPTDGGKRWVLLGDAQLKQAHLVNLDTGQATNLLPMLKDTGFPSGTRVILSGRFSPNEEYIALLTNADLWVAPTSDLSKGRSLESGRAFCGATFSDDSSQVLYCRATESGTEIVLAGVDGSPSRVLATGEQEMQAGFIPGQNKILIQREGKLTMRSVDDPTEQELLAYEGRILMLGSILGGSKLLLRIEGDEAVSWHLVDTRAGTAKELDALKEFLPLRISEGLRWATFTSSLSPAKGARFAGLDAESGEVHPTLTLDEDSMYLGVHYISSDGAYTLVTALADREQQLWLLNNKTGDTRVLVEGRTVGGAFSPDGHTIAFSTIGGQEPLTATLTLADTENDATRVIGEGVAPVWLMP